MTKKFETNSSQETFALGCQLASGLNVGECVAIIGNLGAGKTALVRGLADGLGADVQLVSSPTYVLMQKYPATNMPLFHLDLYRMVDAGAELAELGMDEMLAEGVVVIEWADRAGETLPIPRTEIFIAVTGENSRRFTVKTVD